jgi:hypothetical protein
MVCVAQLLTLQLQQLPYLAIQLRLQGSCHLIGSREVHCRLLHQLLPAQQAWTQTASYQLSAQQGPCGIAQLALQ